MIFVAIECPALFAPDHGTVQGTQYDFNEQVYFACKDGYRLEGSPVRQCQADQTWSGEEVTCTGMCYDNHMDVRYFNLLCFSLSTRSTIYQHY